MKNRTTLRPSNSTCGDSSEEIQEKNSKRYTQPYAHCSTIYIIAEMWQCAKCPPGALTTALVAMDTVEPAVM